MRVVIRSRRSPRAHQTRRATTNPSDEGIDDTFVSVRSLEFSGRTPAHPIDTNVQ